MERPAFQIEVRTVTFLVLTPLPLFYTLQKIKLKIFTKKYYLVFVMFYTWNESV